jgi:hypothetical protein
VRIRYHQASRQRDRISPLQQVSWIKSLKLHWAVTDKTCIGANTQNRVSLAIPLLLVGCASTQLNYNTLDLASTIDVLVINQVLSNLAKFKDSRGAIPSQVALTSGLVATSNSISPSISSPLNLGLTSTGMLATTTAAALSNTVTQTATRTQSNASATRNATSRSPGQLRLRPNLRARGTVRGTVKTWPGNAATVKIQARRPALTVPARDALHNVQAGTKERPHGTNKGTH